MSCRCRLAAVIAVIRDACCRSRFIGRIYYLFKSRHYFWERRGQSARCTLMNIKCKLRRVQQQKTATKTATHLKTQAKHINKHQAKSKCIRE